MLRCKPETAFLFVIALVAALAMAVGPAHAQQPTPTATERQTSTITIRFVRDGEPVEVFFFSPAGISADGVACRFPIPDGMVIGQAHTELSLPWPFLPIEGQPEECTKGPPTTVRIEFDALFVEVLWTGDDVTVDLEVPGAETTPTPPRTPTPTSAVPTPTSVVEKLPGTGFASHEASWAPWLTLALLLAALTLLLLGAAVRAKASR